MSRHFESQHKLEFDKSHVRLGVVKYARSHDRCSECAESKDDCVRRDPALSPMREFKPANGRHGNMLHSEHNALQDVKLSTPRKNLSSRMKEDVVLPSLQRAWPSPRQRLDDETSRKLRKNHVNSLLKQLQDKRWECRKFAVKELSSIACSDQTLNERSRQVAVWATSRIFGNENREIVKELIARLSHPIPQVRSAVLAALGHVAAKGDEETIDRVWAIAKEKDWQVRESAVDALVQVSTPGCPFVLYRMHVLLGDEDWRVRQVALEAVDSLIDRSLPSILFILRLLDQLKQRNEQGETSPQQLELWAACETSIRRLQMVSSIRCKTCVHMGGSGLFSLEQATRSMSTICQSCLASFESWLSRQMLLPFWITFLMGAHPRLGRRSWINQLDTHVLPIILDECK
ncbi:hypothetical protein GUITHDRAFT_108739 [Guillardia theta CCMP2712]|uniref:HEAT repeat domain-containing protein n=1 Tax=Guillardia theta (strain CCMP2712) TaxID=905079 RepID=L1JBK9_GUITC|nr:hypothetical protein GUITHDRAFT_108739 [Guillardia theta CCMP2712]EKX45475.1 hypothetical protein GUITHDRAFT_108739 [Guillardia theta CCMP2712]|eukprot:XP_005832455.1 hypothetical protein GUITHDRAFT_108739 [Guillardia theta CCMP2712]